jgi:LexA-binding, inner membrane-associated putative hydrolase
MADDAGAGGPIPRWPALISPVLWLAVVVDDLVLIPRASGTLALGLLDEPAHLATTLIALIAAASGAGRPVLRADLWLAAGAVAAGNLIDLDHVPQLLGSDVLDHGTARPYPHSLGTVVVLTLLAVVARGRGRRLFTGAAAGVLLHLFRDLATWRVSLLWPVTTASAHLPYASYAIALGVLAVVPLAARLTRTRREEPEPAR